MSRPTLKNDTIFKLDKAGVLLGRTAGKGTHLPILCLRIGLIEYAIFVFPAFSMTLVMIMQWLLDN